MRTRLIFSVPGGRSRVPGSYSVWCSARVPRLTEGGGGGDTAERDAVLVRLASLLPPRQAWALFLQRAAAQAQARLAFAAC